MARQTSDGGYVIATSSSPNCLWLIKTDSAGDIVWDKTFDIGTYGIDTEAQETSDGGYVVVGASSTSSLQLLLIKTDTNGNKVWANTYGSTSGTADGQRVQQTSDGGYILTALASGSPGIWLVKTDSSGVKSWEKTLPTWGGGTTAVWQTSSGEYLASSWDSLDGGATMDVPLIKTDSSGNILWTKHYDTGLNDIPTDDQQRSEGGYVIFASAGSPGSTYSWIIKTDVNGNPE